VTPGLCAFVLAAALLGGGQERPGGGGQRRGDMGERRAPRDEAFKMIDAYIVSNLQESLDLTDDQFVKLLPLVKRLQSDRRDVLQRRQRALMELRRLLGSGGATEARVTDLLRQIKTAEAEEPALLKRDRDAIDAVLSPVQQAKFRVLEVEVERKIRELMGQIRSQRRNQGQSRPNAPRLPEP
jgi:Spy/CpxP family protein refolding chaperone